MGVTLGLQFQNNSYMKLDKFTDNIQLLVKLWKIYGKEANKVWLIGDKMNRKVREIIIKIMKKKIKLILFKPTRMRNKH